MFGLILSGVVASSSFSLSCHFQGINSKVQYIKKPRFNCLIKIIKLTKLSPSSVAILESSGEDKIGFLPVYLNHSSFDPAFEEYFKMIFDTTRLSQIELDDLLQNAKCNMKSIFELSNYEDHRKNERDYSRSYASNPTGLDDETELKIKKILKKSSAYSSVKKFIYCPSSGKISLTGAEGLNIRTLLANESVFLSDEKTVLVIGPMAKKTDGGSLKPFKIARSVDSLNLSLDYLVRAGIVSERAGGKPIELLVVGTQGITEDDIRKRIDDIIKDGEEYSRLVGAALPNERHSALMGGVGISAGYHRHTKNFIFNLRTGVDHIWGKFKQTGPQTMDTESVPRLGWGITLGTGLDYKFTEKSTIGLEGGVRFSEFKIPQQADPKTTKSSWFMAPYAQIVCGFYPTPDYSISVFTGYFFPRTFTVKTEGTKITEGSQCKVDGIFGGLRFARYF